MRYSKLSAEPIPLGDGENPPAQVINPDYKQQPGNSRKCIECGKMHDTIVEDTRTGKRLREIEKCKDCIIFGTVIQPKYKIALGNHDFPTSNISTMSSELNRIVNGK